MAKLDDLIQQKQQRDEDWKTRKAAEREELGQLSDDAVMRVTSEPGAYLHYLDTQAINPRYSASNVKLAMAQDPEITYINSLEVWNRLGRSVNRDENGMKIRVSDTYVKDGREYHGYKIGRVFDISQTHGKAGVPALSLKDNTPEMDAALRRLLDSSPVPVVTSSTMYQDAVYDPKTQSITVSSRLIDSKIFAALSREIVHAGIHDHGRYPYYTREDCAMDAESVSYMLCRNFGVETPQPDVSRVGQVFDGMEVQDRRGVVDSLQKYFRKLQNDIQREISPQERKQPEQNRPVRRGRRTKREKESCICSLRGADAVQHERRGAGRRTHDRSRYGIHDDFCRRYAPQHFRLSCRGQSQRGKRCVPIRKGLLPDRKGRSRYDPHR